MTANGFLFGEMKMFWNSIVVMATQFCEYAKKPLNDTLFFLFSFFLAGGIKSFLNLLQYCFCSVFLVSGFLLAKTHGGSELPDQGSNPHLLH